MSTKQERKKTDRFFEQCLRKTVSHPTTAGLSSSVVATVQPKRLYEGYQKSSVNISSKRTALGPTELITNEASSIPSKNNNLLEVAAQKRRDVSSVSGYEDTVISASQKRGLIARLVDDYREQRERRRMMLCRCVEEIILDDLETTTLRRPACGLDYADIFKVQVVLMYEWVLRLEEFNAIEDPFDKSKLLRCFALRYMLLDNIFHAIELGIRDRVILVNNTFIIPGHIPDISPDENQRSQAIKYIAIEDPFDKSKLLRCFALRYMLLDNIFHAIELGIRDRVILVNNTFIIPGHIPDISPDENQRSQAIKYMMYGERSVQLIDELIAPMFDMNFTIGELMALRLIMFWNPNGVTLSSQTKSIIQLASNRAVNELYRWYADQHFEAIDTRLGNVLLLLSPLTEQVHYMNEMVKLIPSFGVLNEKDSYLQNILAA
uniref:NR LBD domain-containing protein n=1 Tax=Setaria digitata TaxID=48799 RepID=A0A915PV12_9BILA